MPLKQAKSCDVYADTAYIYICVYIYTGGYMHVVLSWGGGWFWVCFLVLGGFFKAGCTTKAKFEIQKEAMCFRTA